MSGIPVATDTAGGITAGKNVFQGVVSANQVTFYGVPVLPPVYTGYTRVFRITNVRILASAFSPISPASVLPAVAAISITGAASLPISSPELIVGFIQGGLSTATSGYLNAGVCTEATKTPVSVLSFSEQFSTAFRTRVAPADNTAYAGQAIPSAQNIPGRIYLSESGLVVSLGSGQHAGLTDAGTRFKARFTNIPPGIRLFVSVNNVIDSSTPVVAPAVPGGAVLSAPPVISFAQLVTGGTADGDAANGEFPSISATTTAPGSSGNVGVAEISVNNGTAEAVWEVINTHPLYSEVFKFAVYATFPSSAGSDTTLVTLGYDLAALPPTNWVPAFAVSSQPLSILSTSGCAPALNQVSPANGSKVTATGPSLNWSARGATSFDVYFGTSPTPPFVQTTTTPSYSPGVLSLGATYYWKIVAKTPAGDLTSPTWAFVSAPNEFVERTAISLSSNIVRLVYEKGGAPPAAQSISVRSDRPAALALFGPAGNWLKATLSSNTTPANLILTVTNTSLPAGTYGDVVAISPSGADIVEVTVSLTVQDPPRLAASVGSLSFSFDAGGTAPSPQRISVGASTRNVDVTASASAAWLKVGPGNAVTPAQFSVSIDPAGLAPGSYTGSVSFTSQSASNSPLTVPVHLTVKGVAPPVADSPRIDANGIVSAATFAAGPAAPGSLISIRGSHLAPTSVRAASTPLPRELGGVSVTIGGTLAPLLFVSPSQVDVQVPFEVLPGVVEVRVSAGGISSLPALITIKPAAPGVFRDSAGRALGGTNPVNAIVSVFLTGQGQVDIQPPTGSAAAFDPLSKPLQPVTASLGDKPVEVTFAGLAPGFVGLLQVNLRIPDVPPGDYPLVFHIAGESSSPALVSIR